MAGLAQPRLSGLAAARAERDPDDALGPAPPIGGWPAGELGRRRALILAIDLGTTEVKTGLVGLDGRLVGLARAGYPTSGGRPGWPSRIPTPGGRRS